MLRGVLFPGTNRSIFSSPTAVDVVVADSAQLQYYRNTKRSFLLLLGFLLVL